MSYIIVFIGSGGPRDSHIGVKLPLHKQGGGVLVKI